ncbi:MAG TPA: AarF/UbiB family protein [Candidatus Limnocylindria bacterium]|nr:AarF/UbiB family protein [Candidatus Limnocylindria bacterium]
MGLSLKPQHLKRYKDIAWLLVKYGRSDLVKSAGLDALDEPAPGPAAPPPEARELADDLETLGPTFIKLGQLLSTRPDVLPPAYLAALARLQDKVEPFAFEDVERIVNAELGARMSKAFADFDPEPMATASLGQVHRATLRDGRRVAVKVQRPGVREQVAADVEALADIAEFMDAHTELGARYQFSGLLVQQILVDGFFHADPHPGNVFLTVDGRIALLDLGMVARVTPRLQDHLLQLLLAVSEGRSDDATAVALKLGERRPHFQETRLARAVADLVARHQNATIEHIQVGAVVLEMARAAADCGRAMPPELTMLGKTLLNLDEVGRALDASFNPNAAVRRHASEIMRQRLMQSASPGNMFSALLDAKEFAERLPGRVNRILDLVAGNELKVRVDAIDETRLMMGLQKIANRITLGLLLAALIVGAALLMQVETSFRILGYPGLAIVFFLLAAAGAGVLMFTILFGDD